MQQGPLTRAGSIRAQFIPKATETTLSGDNVWPLALALTSHRLMPTELSSDAQAILLLTAPSNVGRGRPHATRLTGDEYRRRARRLGEVPLTAVRNGL